MCGIFGAIDPRVQNQHLLDACAVLDHRGPDGKGIFFDPELNVGIAQTRLAIIDLETGDQPLFDEDRDLVLVCNGEIYDFERIRSDLQQEGFSFRTRTDSEVILQLYRKHGTALFEHLRGEFAFLLLDRKKKILMACRDRFGIKPLFVAKTDTDGWIFASEIKAIFASRLKHAEMQFLSDANHDSATNFGGTFALPPGTALLVELSGNTHELLTYWSPNFPARNDVAEEITFSEWKKKADQLLTESIRLRLRADVPVGVYLSGGIDSALLAAKVREVASVPPLAFTVCFPDMSAFDESELARRVADHIGVRHHVV